MFPNSEYEKSLWSKGTRLIVGVDEAGRGPWAGPVAVGAAMLKPESELLSWVRDSKKIAEKKREALFEQLQSSLAAYGVGLVEAEYIDRVGIQKAVLEAMRTAVDQLEKSVGEKVELIICDGTSVLPLPGYKFELFKKGDATHYSISAGAILAKVTRDRLMRQYAQLYPEYGFDRHFGYGTTHHQAMLQRYGPCKLHRKSYKPIQRIIASHAHY